MIALDTTVLVCAHRIDSPFHTAASDYLETLRVLATPAQVRGGAIHDTRIAALCLQHGVRELWSADRDFSRYPALRLRNPLIT